MKKVVSSVVISILVLFAFSGCGASALENLATSFVEDTFAGDYPNASAQMETDFQQNFTEETMTEMAASVTSQCGAFDSVISATVGNDPEYPDYKIVTVNVQFAEDKMQFKLAYNTEKELSGISLLGSEELAATSEVTEDYRNDAKTFLKAIFDEDTAAAYEMLSDSAKEIYTQENLGILKSEAETSLGAFRGFGPAAQTEGAVTVSANFENGTSSFTVKFDSDGKISDITVLNEE